MSLIQEFCKDKTLLLISHRLENLQFFNKIFVLENGVIKEKGNYEQLTKNPDSLFNSLRVSLKK